MKRAKKKKIKRIFKSAFFAVIMAVFSFLVYRIQLKDVQVDYLGDIVNFKTMAKTVAQAFEEKGIIITDGLVVSKALNSQLQKTNVISIDAPLILAQIEEEKIAQQAKEENVEDSVLDIPAEGEKSVGDGAHDILPIEKEKEETKKETTKKTTSRGSTSRKPFSEGFEETSPGVITTAEGEVLEYTEVIQVEATAYCACYKCCGKYPSNKYYGITKTGTRAKVGTIAVDPKVIPMGTKMYIEGLNGAKNYGVGKAEDIGGAIKGKIIDLYFDTHAETIQWGRQQVNVYILKED
ncbi:MAG: hypothetical protein E7314_06850 [Clostridiales bacterium]|nr:hypothetical protein [Clostridiales bacterium]